jgi:hypothetical protein
VWQLILLGLAGVAVWLVSLRVHPYRKCPACGTSGRHQNRRGTVYGNCRRCRNRTLTRRPLKVLMPRLYADIKAGRHGRFH